MKMENRENVRFIDFRRLTPLVSAARSSLRWSFTLNPARYIFAVFGCLLYNATGRRDTETHCVIQQPTGWSKM